MTTIPLTQLTNTEMTDYLKGMAESGEYEILLAGIMRDKDIEYSHFGMKHFWYVTANEIKEIQQREDGEIAIIAESKQFNGEMVHYLRKKEKSL